MKKPGSMSFEEALEALESSVETLRSPDVSLADSMKEFETGMAYYGRCEELLRDAKGKLEIYDKENGRTEELTL